MGVSELTLEELYQAAQAASTSQKWSQAASLWERVYQAQQTPKFNFQLVTALVADRQYSAAINYAAEFEGVYRRSDSAASLYLRALIGSQQFIPARMLIVARVTHRDWSKTASRELDAAERAATSEMAATMKTAMRRFYHLSDQPAIAQAEQIQAAQRLTYEKYVTAAKFLLVDPFLHQLARVEVLDTLRALGVSETVTFQWLDQTVISCQPSALVPVGTDSLAKTVHAALEARIGHQNASLSQELTASLRLQLMYLYPRTELGITDANAWVRLMLNQSPTTPATNLTAGEEKMVHLQSVIQKYNSELLL